MPASLRRTLPIITVVLSCSGTVGEPAPDPILGLAGGDGDEHCRAVGEWSDHAKAERIAKVYQTVADAIDEGGRKPRVAIELESRGAPAVFLPDQRVIVIESAVFDVCTTFGDQLDDCLAFVMGHELSHFALRHYDVAYGMAGVGEGSRDEQLHTKSNLEAQADYRAGFYAHVAGYDALRVGPDVVDRLYSCFGLQDRIPGYLHRKERRSVIEASFRRAKEKAVVFDAASWLLLHGQAHEAQLLFDWVSSEFPSPEVTNNWALAALRSTRSYRTLPSYYDLPWAIDMRSRLVSLGEYPAEVEHKRGAKTAMGSILLHEDKDQKIRLRGEAITALRELVARRPNYLPAQLNLASALLEAGDLALAKAAIDRLELVDAGDNAPGVRADIATLRAVAAAEGKDPWAAYGFLIRAREWRPAHSQGNALIYEGSAAVSASVALHAARADGEAESIEEVKRVFALASATLIEQLPDPEAIYELIVETFDKAVLDVGAVYETTCERTPCLRNILSAYHEAMESLEAALLKSCGPRTKCVAPWRAALLGRREAERIAWDLYLRHSFGGLHGIGRGGGGVSGVSIGRGGGYGGGVVFEPIAGRLPRDVEQVEGADIEVFVSVNDAAETRVLRVRKRDRGPSWEVGIREVDEDREPVSGKRFIVLGTGSGYGEPSAKGVRMGADRFFLLEAYGVPDRTWTAVDGALHDYGMVIFDTNEKGEVRGWTASDGRVK